MTKFLKAVLIIFLALIATIAAAIATFYALTAGAKLDKNKLINYSNTITIYDDAGEEIAASSADGRKNAVKIEDLQDYTKHAFIASEDRNFYRHNGLDYKRMVKATFKNLSSRAFKEGASTISQQLIKNTHLTGDKTIKRKLNEIRLTKQLEKAYQKDEILETYLNTIYFGHNCYGLGNAAKFYFSKNAEDLTLEQSATLVGLLTSPNNLSPFKNEEKCLQKRNIVLKSMLTCNYITDEQYNEAINSPLSAITGSSNAGYNDYLSQVYDELDDLGIDLYYLSDGCRVNTYLKTEVQQTIENIKYETDNSIVMTDVKTGGVNAYKSTIKGAKRQPGSTIKPLLVYAPALQEKLICPATKINDEKVNYNGYSPENYDKSYRGYTSVTECVKQSLNVPAVKTLNALTVEKAAEYAKKMDITLENDEKNLSLALGGMKYGLTLKELCDCYAAFPSGGYKTTSRFIKNIEDKKGKIIYYPQKTQTKIFNASTCSLMNDMLIQTAQSGTAKKLKNLTCKIAAKTGTCGNSDGNTDAYCISYTSSYVLGVWLGSGENAPLNITGGGDCAKLAKEINGTILKDITPGNLDTESGTKLIEIDRKDYNFDNEIVIADAICPKIDKLTIKCAEDNLPLRASTKYSMPTIETPQITVNNNKICILLCQKEYYDYIVERQNNNQKTVIYEGGWQQKICDEAPAGESRYNVTPYYLYEGKKYCGKTYALPQVYVSNNTEVPQKIPDIVNRDWYNE